MKPTTNEEQAMKTQAAAGEAAPPPASGATPGGRQRRRAWAWVLAILGSLGLALGLASWRGLLPGPGILAGRATATPEALDLTPLAIDRAEIADEVIIEQVLETARSVEERPEDAALWLQLGETYQVNNINVRAVTCYDNVIRLEPANARAHHLRAIAKANLGRNEEALADFDRAMALDPYVPTRWRKGFVYLDLNEAQKALAIFVTILRQTPKDYAAALGAARAYLALDRTEEAVLALESLLGRETRNDGYLYLLLSSAYRQLGRTEEADDALNLSAKGRPLLTDPWLDMISLRQPGFYHDLQRSYQLLRENKVDEGLAILLELQKQAPKNATILGNIGSAYLSKGDADTCIDYNEQALAITPKWVYGYVNLSKAYYAKSEAATDPAERAAHLATSRDYAAQALEISPSNPEAIAVDASFFSLDGKTDQAIQRFKDAFEAVDSVDRRNYVGWLFKAGQMESNAGKWEDSIKTLSKVVLLDESNGEAYFRLAMAYGILGDDQKSLAMFDLARRHADPKNEQLMRDIQRFEQQLGLAGPVPAVTAEP